MTSANLVTNEAAKMLFDAAWCDINNGDVSSLVDRLDRLQKTHQSRAIELARRCLDVGDASCLETVLISQYMQNQLRDAFNFGEDSSTAQRTASQFIVLFSLASHKKLFSDEKLLEILESSEQFVREDFRKFPDVAATQFASMATESFFNLYMNNLTDAKLESLNGYVYGATLGQLVHPRWDSAPSHSPSDVVRRISFLTDLGVRVEGGDAEVFARHLIVHRWVYVTGLQDAWLSVRAAALETLQSKASDLGFDIFEVTRLGHTAAYAAVTAGDFDFMRTLASKGVPCMSARTTSWLKKKSTLNMDDSACLSVYIGYLQMYGHHDIAQKELDVARSNPNLVLGGIDAWPRLLAAARSGDHIAFEKFANAGDDVHLKSHLPKHKSDVGAMECAVLSKSLQTVVACIDAGLDIDAKASNGRPIISRTKSVQILDAIRSRSAAKEIDEAMNSIAVSPSSGARTMSPF